MFQDGGRVRCNYRNVAFKVNNYYDPIIVTIIIVTVTIIVTLGINWTFT